MKKEKPKSKMSHVKVRSAAKMKGCKMGVKAPMAKKGK